MRTLLLVISIFFLSGFRSPQNGEVADAVTYQVSVALNSPDFGTYCARVYDAFGLQEHELDREVFEKAMQGYFYLKFHGELERDRFLTIIDYSKSCRERRLWVIDLTGKRVLFHDLVAHGKYSGDEYANRFSNRIESRQSSLGFYVTGSRYHGKHRLSLKLKGMENGFNSNAFARGIVFHGAYYVHENFVARGEKIGRSFGCPAVSQEVIGSLIEVIDQGSCVFTYYPDANYLQNSPILNAELFVPLQELKSLANGIQP